MTKEEFLDKCISFSVKINNLRKYLREKQHEAIEAYREFPVDIGRSKCAARVRSSPHCYKDIELLVTTLTNSNVLIQASVLTTPKLVMPRAKQTLFTR